MDEPVEFEKYPVEIQNVVKITDNVRIIHELYLMCIKKNWKMSTCNWLNLEVLGSGPVMPKN